MQYTPRITSSSQCAAHALYGGRRPTTRTRTCQTQGRQRCCQCPCCSRAAVHAPAAVRGSLAAVGSQRAVVRVASGRPQGPRPPVARRSAAVHSWQGTQPSSTTSRLPWCVAAQLYPLPASIYLEARVSGCPSHPAGAPPPALVDLQQSFLHSAGQARSAPRTPTTPDNVLWTPPFGGRGLKAPWGVCLAPHSHTQRQCSEPWGLCACASAKPPPPSSQCRPGACAHTRTTPHHT
jgi:hypothetical protein